MFQSPKTIVLRGDVEISLYCIVNVLSMKTTYVWHGAVLPSSPVVYVDKPGIYFCTVTDGDEEVTSHCFRVQGIVEFMSVHACECSYFSARNAG